MRRLQILHCWQTSTWWRHQLNRIFSQLNFLWITLRPLKRSCLTVVYFVNVCIRKARVIVSSLLRMGQMEETIATYCRRQFLSCNCAGRGVQVNNTRYELFVRKVALSSAWSSPGCYDKWNTWWNRAIRFAVNTMAICFQWHPHPDKRLDPDSNADFMYMVYFRSAENSNKSRSMSNWFFLVNTKLSNINNCVVIYFWIQMETVCMAIKSFQYQLSTGTGSDGIDQSFQLCTLSQPQTIKMCSITALSPPPRYYYLPDT